jgi:hypothetical protein
MSLRNRHLAQMAVVNGIQRKPTYGLMQVDNERLEFCSQLHVYVTASPPLWDLEYFDRLICVAQSVQYGIYVRVNSNGARYSVRL